MGHVEVAYRRLSVVLDKVYNFYLRHIALSFLPLIENAT